MKKDYAHISFVLDNSGSMNVIKEATIAGYNTFIDKQKKGPGTATFSLYQFSIIESENIYQLYKQDIAVNTLNFMDLNSVPVLTNETYVCQTMTPLLDTIGLAIEQTGEKLTALKEEDRPDQVFFVILTDGQENASQKFTKQKINEMITHQKEKYNWQILFLGANQDAIAVGASYGISAQSSMTYNSTNISVGKTFAATADSLVRSRGLKIAANYSDEVKNSVLNDNEIN